MHNRISSFSQTLLRSSVSRSPWRPHCPDLGAYFGYSDAVAENMFAAELRPLKSDCYKQSYNLTPYIVNPQQVGVAVGSGRRKMDATAQQHGLMSH